MSSWSTAAGDSRLHVLKRRLTDSAHTCARKLTHPKPPLAPETSLRAATEEHAAVTREGSSTCKEESIHEEFQSSTLDPTTNDTSAFIGFFDLPREIRDIINAYHGVPTSREMRGVLKSKKERTSSNAMKIVPTKWSFTYSSNILLGNRQLYAEVMDLCYIRSWLTFTDPEELTAFARRRPRAKAYIRLVSLVITNVSSSMKWAKALEYAALHNIQQLCLCSFDKRSCAVDPRLWNAVLKTLANSPHVSPLRPRLELNYKLTDEQEDDIAPHWDIVQLRPRDAVEWVNNSQSLS